MAMLNAYRRHRQCKQVIQMYDLMVPSNVYPDELAMLAVLSTCQHSSEVVKGLKYFESIHIDYGLMPIAHDGALWLYGQHVVSGMRGGQGMGDCNPGWLWKQHQCVYMGCTAQCLSGLWKCWGRKNSSPEGNRIGACKCGDLYRAIKFVCEG
jgi:pentatricopeptide repeat protein